jgi:hypothetical protein
MMINQIRTFIAEDKGSIIAQTWVGNLDELCQEKETDDIGTEAHELQMKDGKEGKEGEEDSDGESGNLKKDNKPSIIIPLRYYEDHTQSSCFVNKSSTRSSVEAEKNWSQDFPYSMYVACTAYIRD